MIDKDTERTCEREKSVNHLGTDCYNTRGRSQVQITVPFFFPEDECSVIGWLCYLCVVVCCINVAY